MTRTYAPPTWPVPNGSLIVTDVRVRDEFASAVQHSETHSYVWLKTPRRRIIIRRGHGDDGGNVAQRLPIAQWAPDINGISRPNLDGLRAEVDAELATVTARGEGGAHSRHHGGDGHRADGVAGPPHIGQGASAAGRACRS